MMNRKLGYRPDQPDGHDLSAWEVLRAAPPPPPSASLREHVVEVLDQGDASSCTSHAIMQAIRIAHRRAGAALPPLGSRLFGYYLSRAVHHETGQDAGTFLRTFFQALNRFGFCQESAWPYADTLDAVTKMPSSSAFRAAFDQRSPTVYRRISTEGATRIMDIKRAIASGYAVCFGTDIAVDFFEDKGEEPILPPNGMAIAGGHAMVVTGYDPGDVFDVVNSWGAAWGREGYCRFSSDYLAWGKTRDLWLVEKAPEYSEPVTA